MGPLGLPVLHGDPSPGWSQSFCKTNTARGGASALVWKHWHLSPQSETKSLSVAYAVVPLFMTAQFSSHGYPDGLRHFDFNMTDTNVRSPLH